METTKDLNKLVVPTPEIAKEANEALTTGVMFGLAAFIRSHAIDVSPTESCENPPVEFMMRVAEELSLDGETKRGLYPFKNSFREVWAKFIAEINDTLLALHQNGEHRVANQLARTVAFGEFVKFLEANADEAIAEFAKIRGVTNEQQKQIEPPKSE